MAFWNRFSDDELANIGRDDVSRLAKDLSAAYIKIRELRDTVREYGVEFLRGKITEVPKSAFKFQKKIDALMGDLRPLFTGLEQDRMHVQAQPPVGKLQLAGGGARKDNMIINNIYAVRVIARPSRMGMEVSSDRKAVLYNSKLAPLNGYQGDLFTIAWNGHEYFAENLSEVDFRTEFRGTTRRLSKGRRQVLHPGTLVYAGSNREIFFRLTN